MFVSVAGSATALTHPVAVLEQSLNEVRFLPLAAGK
jgi:hypothetical protein